MAKTQASFAPRWQRSRISDRLDAYSRIDGLRIYYVLQNVR